MHVRALWKDVVGRGPNRVRRDRHANHRGVFQVMGDGFSKRFSTLGFSYTIDASYKVSFGRMKIVSFYPRK